MTEPLISYYKDLNVLQDVNGTKNIEELFKDFLEILGDK